MSKLDQLEAKYSWYEHSNKNETIHIKADNAISEEEMLRFCQDYIVSSGKADNISDGYHTFNELYDFRRAYNVALFNLYSRLGIYEVHKSERHHDGELCFGGGWFIVSAMLPTGQISNHYPMADWDLFECMAVDKALREFDGHTGTDVIHRLQSIDTYPDFENLKTSLEELIDLLDRTTKR